MKLFSQSNGVMCITEGKASVFSQGVKLSFIIYADTKTNTVRAIVPDALKSKYEAVVKQVDPNYRAMKLVSHKNTHWFEFKVPELHLLFE